MLSFYGDNAPKRHGQKLPGGGLNRPNRPPKKGARAAAELDPQRRAEMLVESLMARQDVTLTLDRL